MNKNEAEVVAIMLQSGWRYATHAEINQLAYSPLQGDQRVQLVTIGDAVLTPDATKRAIVRVSASQ